MPGHTRSIYSRRQRTAPGQFDNPLADFLDRLPDYFNDYQRNQLALGRQQLAEKRYEDSQKRQARMDEENKRRYDLQQKNIEINRQRADDQFIKTQVMSLVRSGKYGVANQMLSGLNDPDSQSLKSVIEQASDKKEKLDSAFKNVRSVYFDPNVSVYKKQEVIDSFKKDFSDDLELGSGIDDSIARFSSKINLEAQKQNRGFKPLDEWMNVEGGREDIQKYKNAESAIKEATEQLNKLKAGTPGIEGTEQNQIQIIEENEEIINKLTSKPQYRTETRAQYDYRTKSLPNYRNKAIPKMFGSLSGAIPDMPNLAFGQGTDQEFTESSPEDMASFEESLNKELDSIRSDPSEEKMIQKEPTIQDLLNLPAAQAMRARRPMSIVDPLAITRLLQSIR
tara:strand:- start:5763 stop:6944 length:1182 start_codon:yes stop_codon:yes gene_type:complete